MCFFNTSEASVEPDGKRQQGRAKRKKCRSTKKDLEIITPLPYICILLSKIKWIRQLNHYRQKLVKARRSFITFRAHKKRSFGCHAGIAQLVEHHLAKVNVASSSLVSRSTT
jgi:hypothetical protein